MKKEKLARALISLAKQIVAADTFPCPICGTKVLNQTKYCVKCKKKVEPKEASRRERRAEKSKLQKEYAAYFEGKLKEFDVGSPSELDEAKKKEFFNSVDKGWIEGKGEK